MKIIGVDCATVNEKIGLALVSLDDCNLQVREATVCSRQRSAASTIVEWISSADGPFLLAIDAPLGWPELLSRVLVTHRAGEAIDSQAHDLFRRATDRFVQERTGKTPLDVGADRIARTAHAALRLLGDVRRETAREIPLAWSADDLRDVMAIEVYPAATLKALGLRSVGYKPTDQIERRREIVEGLSRHVVFGTCRHVVESSADALDAVVCALAGRDFASGRALPPADLELARREGWIWTAVA